jgi:LacI family transcriptional regulator
MAPEKLFRYLPTEWRGHEERRPSEMTERPARPVLRRQITIHDVAREAGLSIGTVSKALNGQGSLRGDTMAHVSAVARRLGYRPNALAQSLHRHRSFTVGLLSNDMYGRFTLPILAGVEHALAAHNVSVFLCSAADGPEHEQRQLDSLLSKRVDGLIVTARRIDAPFPTHPCHTGLPMLHANLEARMPGALSLVPDEAEGARLGTAHLVRLGRRRIAHVTGPVSFRAVHLRKAGYQKALDEAGLPPARPPLHGPWSEAWGREAVTLLFAGEGPHPDAIFCGSDQIARGVADALRELGLVVPRDVALVGFDNWEVLAAATRPALTTVDPNLHALGTLAGTTLLGMVDDPAPQTGVLRTACSLIIRESCGGRALD